MYGLAVGRRPCFQSISNYHTFQFSFQRERGRIVLIIAALNDLVVKSTDIFNACVQDSVKNGMVHIKS